MGPQITIQHKTKQQSKNPAAPGWPGSLNNSRSLCSTDPAALFASAWAPATNLNLTREHGPSGTLTHSEEGSRDKAWPLQHACGWSLWDSRSTGPRRNLELKNPTESEK